jgi:N4-gp56 family major capsid protein
MRRDIFRALADSQGLIKPLGFDKRGRRIWPVAGGAVDAFIPEVWNASLLTRLEQDLVLAAPGAINRDYEGDIAQKGDTVHIGTLTDPTVSDYVKNVTVIDPQTLATTDQTLVIDQSKYFAFEVDDVDARQAAGDLLTKAAQRSAVKLQETADTYVGTIMTANAGKILTPAAITTSDQAFSILIRLKVALDRANVPQQGRWVAVSPEFYGLLLLDPRFNDAARSGSTDALRNGIVGSALGFTVKVSTNLPVGTAATAPAVSSFIIAGHPMATTFADQIAKTEAFRPQSSFSDAVKGLHLYGAKVVRPEALAVQDVDVTI